MECGQNKKHRYYLFQIKTYFCQHILHKSRIFNSMTRQHVSLRNRLSNFLFVCFILLKTSEYYRNVKKCILNWPLSIGAFQDQYKQTMINKYSNKHNYVKNPNWQEATSWLFTSAAEKLNSRLPRTTSARGQNGIWTRVLRISNPEL